jgi:predicted amidohydrolase YtcJ
MQPYHKADDGRYAEAYIGEERCRSSYAFRSLIEGGAVVCFGSDWPVVSANPWLGVAAAVTGKTLDGKTWQTQESISVEEALKCYTSRAAWAARAEDEIGRIAVGLRADFVVLSESPFDDGVDLEGIEADAVYVDGKLVHARE